MANTKRLTAGLPDEVLDLLTTMGANLRIARKRRRMSVAALAERLMVSSPTVRKLERGDPTLSLGVFVTALWVMGLADGWKSMAVPETDGIGLREELRRLTGRGGRKPDDGNDF